MCLIAQSSPSTSLSLFPSSLWLDDPSAHDAKAILQLRQLQKQDESEDQCFHVVEKQICICIMDLCQ